MNVYPFTRKEIEDKIDNEESRLKSPSIILDDRSIMDSTGYEYVRKCLNDLKYFMTTYKVHTIQLEDLIVKKD